MPVFKVYRDGTEMSNGIKRKIQKESLLYMNMQGNKIYNDYVIERFDFKDVGNSVVFRDLYSNIILAKMQNEFPANILINGLINSYIAYDIDQNGNQISINKSASLYNVNSNNLLENSNFVNQNVANLNEDEALYVALHRESIYIFTDKDVDVNAMKDEDVLEFILKQRDTNNFYFESIDGIFTNSMILNNVQSVAVLRILMHLGMY